MLFRFQVFYVVWAKALNFIYLIMGLVKMVRTHTKQIKILQKIVQKRPIGPNLWVQPLQMILQLDILASFVGHSKIADDDNGSGLRPRKKVKMQYKAFTLCPMKRKQRCLDHFQKIRSRKNVFSDYFRKARLSLTHISSKKSPLY